MKKEQAETIALEILAFTAADDYLFGSLINLSGLTREDFRTSINDPHFVAQVMDFFLTQDKAVENFLDARGYSAGDLNAARAALPGQMTF